jgi:hypothetical protein
MERRISEPVKAILMVERKVLMRLLVGRSAEGVFALKRKFQQRSFSFRRKTALR